MIRKSKCPEYWVVLAIIIGGIVYNECLADDFGVGTILASHHSGEGRSNGEEYCESHRGVTLHYKEVFVGRFKNSHCRDSNIVGWWHEEPVYGKLKLGFAMGVATNYDDLPYRASLSLTARYEYLYFGLIPGKLVDATNVIYGGFIIRFGE